MILAPAIQNIDELLAQPFDFVIAGGGTAGLTLASLLSDDASLKVLVLDRGVYRPDDLTIKTPGMWVMQLGNPEYDAGYMSVPQVATGRPMWFSAAKALGGGSTRSSLYTMGATAINGVLAPVNAMSFIPAPRNELKAWVELGNSSESIDSLLNEVRAVEGYKESSLDAAAVHAATGKAEHRGSIGPLPGRHATFVPEIVEDWYKTLDAVGIPTQRDPRETGSNFGGFMVQNCITDSNERADAATSFYTSRASRENLVIVTEAHILELSGIGNPAVLEAAGIKPNVDLPGVGENHHEHWSFGQSFRVQQQVTTLDHLRDPAQAKTEAELYATSRTGALASGQVAVSYISAPYFFSKEEIVDMQQSLDEDIAVAPMGLGEQYKVMRDWLSNPDIPFIEIVVCRRLPEPPHPSEKFITMYTFLTHPFSRGSIHIESPDPAAPPVIDPRFWSHPLGTRSI
ncbi:alcohol oxidase [Auriculariales sp. MPI-PUGE-AT-0066]|nr:alcohol oxidase [Auriculariales sp. MPI-PUGE-AT-0066]